MVPKKGLEPPHPCGYMDLNHARLPIPPLRRGKRTSQSETRCVGNTTDCTSGVVDAQRGDRSAGCGGVALGVAQHALLAVLLQLVVQGLQADAEYFGGA